MLYLAWASRWLCDKECCSLFLSNHDDYRTVFPFCSNTLYDSAWRWVTTYNSTLPSYREPALLVSLGPLIVCGKLVVPWMLLDAVGKGEVCSSRWNGSLTLVKTRKVWMFWEWKAGGVSFLRYIYAKWYWVLALSEHCTKFSPSVSDKCGSMKR